MLTGTNKEGNSTKTRKLEIDPIEYDIPTPTHNEEAEQPVVNRSTKYEDFNIYELEQ